MAEKKDYSDLFYRYEKHGKIFPVERFNRMMNSYDAEHLRYIIKEMSRAGGYGRRLNSIEMSDEDVNRVLVEVLNEYGPYNIKKLEKDMMNHRYSQDFLMDIIYRRLNINPDLITYNVIPSFGMELLKEGVQDASALYRMYGDAVFDLLSNNCMESVEVELPKEEKGGLHLDPYTFSSMFVDFSLDELSEDIRSYKDLLSFYSRNKGNDEITEDPLKAFNEIFTILLEKYSVEELFNNVETIQKEIRTGFVLYLPDRPELSVRHGSEVLSARPNAFSNNREIFDKMLDHFDTDSLPIILDSEQYLKPMLDMINSSKLEPEELDSIRDSYEFFKQITELRKAGKYQQLLTLIEKTEEKEREESNDPDVKFCDILNGHVLNYEELLRKDIVQNTRSFEDTNLTTVIPEDIYFKPLDVEAKSVEHVDQLSSALVSFVKPKKLDISTFAMVCYEYLVNKKLPKLYAYDEATLDEVSKKTQLDLFALTMDMYERMLACTIPGSGFNITNIAAILNPKMSLEEFKALGLPEPKAFRPVAPELKNIDGKESLLSPEELKECIGIYKNYEAARDTLQPYRTQTRSDVVKKYLFELLDKYNKPRNDKEKSMRYNVERVISYFVESGLHFNEVDNKVASVLRLTSLNDFNSLINNSQQSNDKNLDEVTLAIAYDGKTIPEEAIVYSSLSHDRFGKAESKFPLSKMSAPLTQLETTVNKRESRTYPYDTAGEVLIDASYAKPSHVLAFYNPRDPGKWSSLNPVVSEKAASKLEEAQRIANERNMDLIIVNCPSICKELAEMDAKKEAEFNRMNAKENGVTAEVKKDTDNPQLK